MRLKTSKKKKFTTITNSPKTHASKQKQKRQHFYMLTKHLRGRKYLSKQKQKRQHFYMLTKHLRGRKYISKQKQKRQHFYALKNV